MSDTFVGKVMPRFTRFQGTLLAVLFGNGTLRRSMVCATSEGLVNCGSIAGTCSYAHIASSPLSLNLRKLVLTALARGRRGGNLLHTPHSSSTTIGPYCPALPRHCLSLHSSYRSLTSRGGCHGPLGRGLSWPDTASWTGSSGVFHSEF
jgi:hypothetical protein